MNENGLIRRPPPPEEMSFVAFVNSRWNEMRTAALRNRDISFEAALIERRLAKGRAAQAEGNLLAGFNWEADLTTAEDHHALNLRWVNTISANYLASASYWKDIARRETETATAMMISGVNLIIAGHGATAIAALNALVSDRGDRFEPALMWTIFGACIGLMLAAAGKAYAIELLASTSNKIVSKLTFPSPLRVRAINKYMAKARSRPAQVISWLLYGSIGWFVFYVLVALLLIVNS